DGAIQKWRQTHFFSEVDISSDITKLFYSGGDLFLDSAPQLLFNPYVAEELLGLMVGGLIGTATTAKGLYDAHQIVTVIDQLKLEAVYTAELASIASPQVDAVDSLLSDYVSAGTLQDLIANYPVTENYDGTFSVQSPGGPIQVSPISAGANVFEYAVTIGGQ